MDIFSLYIILTILGLHYIADFICQTHDEATNKSSSMPHLITHVSKYTLVVWVGIQIFIVLPLIQYNATYYHPAVVGKWGFLGLSYLTMFYIFITHLATDYITSRISSKLWKKGKMHEFFSCVGIDQYIHYITLFVILIPII